MATQREIRRRIRSITNTKQITRAMELVAASRMRRAQMRVAATRPYAEKMRAMLTGLTTRTATEEEYALHPLLQRPATITRSALVVFTTDRGLCGALNSNLVRRALQVVQAARREQREVDLITIGRKGPQFLRREPVNIVAEFDNLGYRPTLAETAGIARLAIESFLADTYDEVQVLYPRFVSTLQQEPTLFTLLPIAPPEGHEEPQVDVLYLYEPSPEQVLAQLLPRYVEVVIYETILESIASEMSARMVAMRNATENAGELLRDLQLSYNKARQATITREMIEVASGSLALA